MTVRHSGTDRASRGVRRGSGGRAFILLPLTAVACGGAPAAVGRSSVAVFGAEIKEARSDRSLGRALEEHFGQLVDELGPFRRVPPDQVRRALTRRGRRRPRPCTDPPCHVEIGRKVAARKALAWRVEQNLLGECDVHVVLYDLVRSGRDVRGHGRTGCDPEALKSAADQLVCRVLLDAWAAEPPPPGAPALSHTDCRAQAEFAWVEQRREAFQRLAARGSPAADQDGKFESKLAEEVLALKAGYDRVSSLGSAQWTLAAMCQSGKIYDQFARALNASRKAAAPSAATRPGSTEDPLEQRAAELYRACLDHAGKLHLENRYTDQARLRLRSLEAAAGP